MEPTAYASYSGPEADARFARDAALTQRPSEAPLPAAVAWRRDCEPHWLAARQYFQAAQGFYRAYDHARGDYCIARGDAHARLALLCVHANSTGIAPLLDTQPQSDPAVGLLTRAELRARVAELRGSLDPQVAAVPPLPAQVANAGQCDSFHREALHYLDRAIGASDEMDLVGVIYWLGEVDTAEMLWDICEQILHAPS